MFELKNFKTTRKMLKMYGHEQRELRWVMLSAGDLECTVPI